MKKHFILIALLCLIIPQGIFAQNEQDSLALVNANWNWQNLGKGAKAGYALIPMFGAKQSIAVVKYPAKKFKTEIINCGNPDHDITPAVAKKNGGKAAINATYFDVKKLINACFMAINGKVVANMYPNELYRVNGYVAVKDSKKHDIEIGFIDTTKYSTYAAQYQEFMTSGPVVLLNSNIPTFKKDKGFYDKRHPRTMMGYDDKGYIYYVVIDGRFPQEGAFGATISEVAHIARYLGMTYALNLDGGGSSTLWTEKTGVLNHPFDNLQFDHEGCRKVPSIVQMK